ncbi:MAG: cytochrome c biogenesis protein CcsA [Gammaproteobacteria bacterium]|nr:cytochrome c biogenesis protein CcsA [Gammaproteobacteria bacterium]
MSGEVPWLYAGLASYALATVLAWRGLTTLQLAVPAVQRRAEYQVLIAVLAGVALLVTALALRWQRLGHGPFVNLFELLMSQLFSLGLIYALVYWRVPQVRPAAAVTLALFWVLGLWILALEPVDSVLPPTYSNDWLWAHVGFGKVFLSFCLVGSGIAGVILLRRAHWFARRCARLPDDAVLDQLAWRFMLIAFVFHSLMLVAGAVWAQDAWGRYWAWDALETSSFLNWLGLGAALHARATYRVPVRVGAALICILFVFAFFTYFGAPFYSEAAHKGVI